MRTRGHCFQSFSVDAFNTVLVLLRKEKVKRQEITRKIKREKGQRRLQSMLAISKVELADPVAKKVRLASSR